MKQPIRDFLVYLFARDNYLDDCKLALVGEKSKPQLQKLFSWKVLATHAVQLRLDPYDLLFLVSYAKSAFGKTGHAL